MQKGGNKGHVNFAILIEKGIIKPGNNRLFLKKNKNTDEKIYLTLHNNGVVEYKDKFFFQNHSNYKLPINEEGKIEIPNNINKINDNLVIVKTMGFLKELFLNSILGNTTKTIYQYLYYQGDFNETKDKRFIISLSGIIRFRIKKEINKQKLYRNFEVDYSEFLSDLDEKNQIINYDKKKLLNKIKIFFKKINYPIDFTELDKLNLDQLVSTVTMITPFSVQEKQKLIETVKIEDKVKILDEIISFSLLDFQENKTIQ